MFSHTVTTFGSHQKHTLIHPKLKTQLSFVPECGGFLSALHLSCQNKSIHIMEGCNSYEEWKEDIYYKSAWLLPFPNRLKDGQYKFEGKNYQFPINDVGCHNALHGFVAGQKMKLQKVVLTPSYAEAILEYVYSGGLDYYPFPFHFQIKYLLLESQMLIELKITNSGNQTIPIGVGFHPYFQLSTPRVDGLQLQLPSCKRIEVGEKMIPTGRKTSYIDFEKNTSIGNTAFDTGFKATSIESDTHKIFLTDLKHNLQLTYFQDSAFPYFQLYIPPHRKSIAIEPMSCNIDAFNNGEGLTLLEKGKSWKGSFGVAISQPEAH